MRPAASILGLLLVTAGCLGGGTDTDTGADTPDASIDAAADAPEDGNETSTVTETQARDGSVTSVNFVVGATNPDGDTVQTFQVGEGTLALVLNVTADGGELDVRIAAPDCEASLTNTCEDAITTEGGAATYAVDDPEPGEWSVRFFHAEPGVAQIAYVVEITSTLPAA